jgi:type IV secretion system protein VirB4
VARLDLSRMDRELKVLSGTESSVRSLDAIREEVGDDPARWLPLFLKRTAAAERRP